jgi:hypothetical protein
MALPVIERDGVRRALEVSIARHPYPDGDRLCGTDAARPRQLRRLVRASLIYWGHPQLIEVAELLLTELVTNALQHGRGDVGVRVYLKHKRCVIEVDDGSPLRPKLQHAGPADEGGRGLLLVESLAESWEVSEDGTTTKCALPLPEGPIKMEPVAPIAPVEAGLPLDLPADPPQVVRAARLQARTLLTVLGWPGNQPSAISVLHCLVDNAVRYGLSPGQSGERLEAWLSVTTANELLVEVTDPNPLFPGFDKAVAGELGRSLWSITQQQHGATLLWFVNVGFMGKTVRAVMRPGAVDL